MKLTKQKLKQIIFEELQIIDTETGQLDELWRFGKKKEKATGPSTPAGPKWDEITDLASLGPAELLGWGTWWFEMHDYLKQYWLFPGASTRGAPEEWNRAGQKLVNSAMSAWRDKAPLGTKGRNEPIYPSSPNQALIWYLGEEGKQKLQSWFPGKYVLLYGGTKKSKEEIGQQIATMKPGKFLTGPKK